MVEDEYTPSRVALAAATAWSGKTFDNEKEAITDLAHFLESFAGNVCARATAAYNAQAPLWLVWSIEHNAWWGPDHCGYVKDRRAAGLYSYYDAYDIVRMANEHRKSDFPPNEAMIQAT